MIFEQTIKVSLEYLLKIDSETGEILETKLLNKKEEKLPNKTSSVSKKTKVDNGETPKAILESNKLCLNDAAVSLMGVSPEDKIDVKYDKDVPIIGIDEHKGNKLTKSNTISFRGKKNEELAKYGSSFIVKEHPNKEGLFILESEDGGTVEDVPSGDENVSIPEDFNLDIEDLIEDDKDVKEIDSNFFKL